MTAMIDAYDVQEILRALELQWAHLRNIGNDGGGTKQLIARWHEVMDRLGIDRYGANDVHIRMTAAPVADAAPASEAEVAFRRCPTCGVASVHAAAPASEWLTTEFERCREAVAKYERHSPPDGTGARVCEAVERIVDRLIAIESAPASDVIAEAVQDPRIAEAACTRSATTVGDEIADDFDQNKRSLTDAEKRRLAGMIDAKVDQIIAERDRLSAACEGVRDAQAAGELSYRSSDGCGYEAMLGIERVLRGSR
jgi:hypothetical protein